MPKYVLDSVHLPNTPRMNVVAKNIVKKKNLKTNEWEDVCDYSVLMKREIFDKHLQQIEISL